MRILYCARDQRVPGTLGGSVHTRSVAEGLVALGHEVRVLVTRGDGQFPSGPVEWVAMPPILGRPQLRMLGAARVRHEAERFRPHVVMERYYNFGGEGIRAARHVGARSALEVNAPVIDYPGSSKARLDRLLLVQPMRRWREWQCDAADLVITPQVGILPPGLSPSRVLEIEWGADTERFRPGARGPVPFARPAGTLVVFAGAFRAWHGASLLVDAMRTLHGRGVDGIHAVLIGDGPELPAARAAAADLPSIAFTGALPHEAIPACLASADIGAAPFEIDRHRPLELGFYWSPLKVFEYMASGLPVVAPALPRMAHLVGHERAGLLYAPSAVDGLADALQALHEQPDRRRALGAAARARAVEEFSWSAHCRRLAAALERVVA